MYIQITTRCNMKCKHCCFAATLKGQDMSREVFAAAMALNAERDEYATIGGGEPTLHPLFWEFVGVALGAIPEEEGKVGLVTNGSQTKTALALASLASRGVLGVALSQDTYHDPIAPEVTRAFVKTERFRDHDLRSTRKDPWKIYAAGRGRKMAGSVKECCCDGLIVTPDGTLWACGCKTLKFGTVFAPDIPEEFENNCMGVEVAARQAREQQEFIMQKTREAAMKKAEELVEVG